VDEDRVTEVTGVLELGGLTGRGGRIALALVAAAAMLGGACTGDAGKAGRGIEPIVLTMASRYKEIGWAPGAAYFVQRAGELSGGVLRIDVASGYGADGDLDLQQGIVRDVAAGKVDLAWVGTGAFDTLGIKSFQALTAPMLIDNYPLMGAVIGSDIPGQMLPSLDQLGVTGLAVLADSLRKPAATGAPILGSADWSGITFAVVRSNAQAEAIDALRAHSSELIGSPLSSALEDGTVRGRDVGLKSYTGAGLENGVPYVTANVNLWPQTLVLLANPHLLSTLTAQQREWLMGAARDAANSSTGLVDQDTDNAVVACRDGARMAEASDQDLAWLRASFAPVYADLERDPQTKTFIDRIQQLKSSTPPGPALAIPAGCTGPLPNGSADDPLAGTWQTERLTESQIVQAFVAAGGSEKEGHTFFSQLGNGSTEFVVITLQFQNGQFTEFESGDGRSPVGGSSGRYEIGPDDTVTFSGCPEGLSRFELAGDTLRIYQVTSCNSSDEKYGITLFESFPFTRTG
jgi:TRAP-type transport system periplasmic protein